MKNLTTITKEEHKEMHEHGLIKAELESKNNQTLKRATDRDKARAYRQMLGSLGVDLID